MVKCFLNIVNRPKWNTIRTSGEENQTKAKCDVPQPCELLYPVISGVFLQYGRDDLDEFCPVFDTGTVT
jgi:hypothetical protein